MVVTGMTLHTGEILDGKYRIIRELGSGSMGAVYEGENVRIRRRVAIKVLHPGIAQKTSVVRRFEQEAQAAGRIGSDHIVEVLDLGTMHDGGFYMVMEFLEGETLSERIKRNGRLAPKEVSPIAQQLLFGLEMAHEARIVHRDLKPDNVFLVREHAGQRDFVKILDFGISKFNPLAGDDGMSMTKTGTVMGTPFYMAPEQAKGSRDVDHRSDLYSVGVILYEAVTGQVPFHAGTFNELIFKIVLEAPPPPETYVPDLDPAFSRIIRRSMARDVPERFQSAAEFRETLSLWLHTGRDDKSANVTPPPLAASNEWPPATKGEGGGTVLHSEGPDPGATPEGTHLMEPDEDGAATRVVEEEEDIATTRVTDGNLPEPATRMVDASPLSGLGPSSKGKPPPPPRRKPEAQAGPDGGGPRGTAPIPAVPEAQAATVAFDPSFVPPGAAPPAPSGMAPSGLAPPGLGPNAPTPITNRAYHEDDVWPVAGVPKQSHRMTAIIAGSIGALIIGAGLAVWLLGSSEGADAQTTQEMTEEVADGTGDEETAPEEASATEASEADDDEAAADDGDPDDETTEAPPEPPAPPPPPVAPKPVTVPRPLPVPKALPPPPPKPSPTPKPTPKPTGRPIQTEL